MRFKMSGLAALGALMAMSSLALAADTPVAPPGLYFDSKEAFAKPTGDRLFNQMIGNNSLLVVALRRVKPGVAEYHVEKSDVIYVTAGSATFVTGGKIVNAKEESPGELRGTSIEAGKELNVKAGDVVIVPKGTPHWFKAVNGSVEYFAVQFK